MNTSAQSHLSPRTEVHHHPPAVLPAAAAPAGPAAARPARGAERRLPNHQPLLRRRGRQCAVREALRGPAPAEDPGAHLRRKPGRDHAREEGQERRGHSQGAAPHQPHRRLRKGNRFRVRISRRRHVGEGAASASASAAAHRWASFPSFGTGWPTYGSSSAGSCHPPATAPARAWAWDRAAAWVRTRPWAGPGGCRPACRTRRPTCRTHRTSPQVEAPSRAAGTGLIRQKVQAHRPPPQGSPFSWPQGWASCWRRAA